MWWAIDHRARGWRPLVGMGVVLLALAGCTGTQEAQLPTLLVIGSAGPGGPQLSLVEDIRDPAAAQPRRLEPVANSERPLPAPPVSLDVVDRNGARGELVVLIDDSARTELRFFSLEGLNGSDPSAFEESRELVDLDTVLADVIAAVSQICLAQVQVSGDGRFVALFDDGTCRDGSPQPDIYVVDTIAQALVYSVSIEDPDILPFGIYVDQSRDLLYFASGSILQTDVLALPLDGPEDPAPVGSVSVPPLIEVEGTDLAPAGGGIAVLADDALAVVSLADEDPSAPVRTLLDARKVLPDPSRTLDEIVVYSSNRIAVHTDAVDADPELSPPSLATLVDATLEPVERFAYLLADGGIYILDLIPRSTAPIYGLDFHSIEGLTEPRVISWTYAADEGAAGP
jgi:hypothetical protein